MAVLKDVIQALETATNPVAKVLHKGNQFKVLVIGFNKGMILKEHQAHVPSKITVLSGSIIYREQDNEQKLLQYEELDIPVNVPHSVEAVEASLCLLTQG